MGLKPQSVKYFENFDGLRFISACAVLLFHKFNNAPWLFYDEEPILYRICSFIFRNGFIGVNFFLVLSGFLITYLIHQEIYKTGKFSFKTFIIRRILRIWPLYFLILAIGFYLKGNLNGIGYYVSFLSNIEVIYQNKFQTGILFPLWSVSIEEQYYFLIPIIIFFFRLRKPNHFFLFYGTLLMISTIYQIINREDINKLHYATISCITDLSLGGIVATFAFHSRSFIARITNLGIVNIGLIYAIGFSFVIVRVYFHSIHLIHSFERIILAAFFAFILVEQTYSKNSLFKMKSASFSSKTGQYTYGIYLIHMIFIEVVHTIWLKFEWYDNAYIDIFVKTALVFILTYVASILSYKYFEGPFLKLKKRFSAFKPD